MKKIISLIVAVMAMSTITFAGGEIQPVEPVVEATTESPLSGFYVGAGYSMMSMNVNGYGYGYDAGTHTTYELNGVSSVSREKAYMLQIGYEFNKNLALEGRYHKASNPKYKSISTVEENGTNSITDAGESDADYMISYSVYFKPTLPLSEKFSLYALLGYGKTKLSDGGLVLLNENGFQWGGGLNVNLTNHLSMFVDYERFTSNAQFTFGPFFWYESINYDYSKVDAINFGISYRF
jgi:opacity protein-like surface antigen